MVFSAYTPESFEGRCRGTGTGIAHSLSRITGLCAPIIAANMTGASNILYISGALVLVAFVAMLLLKDIKGVRRSGDGNRQV